MPSSQIERKLCKNCNYELVGLYCSECGQKNIESFTFSKLVKDFFDNIFSLDSRLFQTLKFLIIRPGFLTNEYWSGKRITYFPPFRLYLFTSIIHFGVDRYMGHGLEDANYMFLILMPFIAFILLILYRKDNLLYFHHFITTLHFNSAFHLILIINHIIELFINDIIQMRYNPIIDDMGLLIFLIYLFIMMKNIYDESLIITVLKFVVFICAYAILIAGVIFTTQV